MIQSFTKAKEEIRGRRSRRPHIRAAVDRHIAATYGIDGFGDLVAAHLARSAGVPPEEIGRDGAFGFLARQVPGICSEDVAHHLVCRSLGATPIAVAFTTDTFSSGNADKLFRAKVPFAAWSKKGNLVVGDESIVTAPRQPNPAALDGFRFSRLLVGETSLPEHHRRMQEPFFGALPEPRLWADVAPLYGELLARAKRAGKAPAFVWRESGDGRERESSSYTEDEALALSVRPPAEWYYPLYLAMFLDGTFVLVENEGESPSKVRGHFEIATRRAFEATGFSPIVVKMAPHRRDMAFVNRHILENPEGAAAALGSIRHWGDDTVAASRWFADQAIQFGRPDPTARRA